LSGPSRIFSAPPASASTPPVHRTVSPKIACRLTNHSSLFSSSLFSLEAARIPANRPDRLRLSMSALRNPTLLVFSETYKHLGHAKKSTPLFSMGSAYLQQKHTGWHLPTSFVSLALFILSRKGYRVTRLTAFFSIPVFHFSSLSFTLAEISHLFAHSYEKYPGPSYVPIQRPMRLSAPLSVSTSLPPSRLFVRDSLITLRSTLNETL
jgi:hypothetical protein